MAGYGSKKTVDPSFGAGRYKVQRGVDSGEFVPTGEQDAQYQTTAVGEDFKVDPALLRDIYTVYNAKNIYFDSDEEAVKQWYSDMVWQLGNTMSTAFGKQGYFSATGIEDESTRQANNRLREAYWQMPSFYSEGGMGWSEGAKQWGLATVSDPLNLTPIGWGARAAKAGYVGTKVLGQTTKSLAGKRARQAALGEGTLAAGIVGAQDVAIQSADVELGIQDDIRWGQVGAATTMGFGGGATFGGIFAAIGGKMTANKVQRNIDKLTSLGWSPQQIRAMLGKNAVGDPVDTKWFDTYANNDITPEAHRNTPKEGRADLGGEEPVPNNTKSPPLLTGPVQKYEDVHSELNQRVSDAQENANILDIDGADQSVYIEQRDQALALRRIVRAHEAKKTEGGYDSPEHAEQIELLILDAVNDPNDAVIQSLRARTKRKVDRAADEDVVFVSERDRILIRDQINKEADELFDAHENGQRLEEKSFLAEIDHLEGQAHNDAMEAEVSRRLAGKDGEPVVKTDEPAVKTGEGAGDDAVDPEFRQADESEDEYFDRVGDIHIRRKGESEDDYFDRIKWTTPHRGTGKTLAEIKASADEVIDPVPDKAIDTLDKSDHITDEIFNFGEKTEGYATARMRGPKAALQKAARVLNKEHGETIDPKLPNEELSHLVHDASKRANEKRGVEEVADLSDQLADEVEAQVRESNPSFSLDVHSPRIIGEIQDLIDDTVDDFLDMELDGDWKSAGEALKARLLKPISDEHTVRGGSLDEQIDTLPRKIRSGVRKSIEKRLARSEKLRSMFRGIEDKKTLEKVIADTKRYVLSLYGFKEDVTKLSIRDLDPENVEIVMQLRAFSKRARTAKGEGIFDDPIFDTIRNRVFEEEIEAARTKTATKGSPSSLSGRLASGIGLTVGKSRGPRRARVRRDWGGDGTKGLEVARAKAETSGSDSPVPFVAAKREKVTSEKVQQVRKDGTGYVGARWAKKGSKLWYDPIMKLVWSDDRFDDMLAMRGDGPDKPRHLRGETEFQKSQDIEKKIVLKTEALKQKEASLSRMMPAGEVATARSQAETLKKEIAQLKERQEFESSRDVFDTEAEASAYDAGDGSAGRYDSGDVATRRAEDWEGGDEATFRAEMDQRPTESTKEFNARMAREQEDAHWTDDTPEGHVARVGSMSEAELDLLATKIASALKIKRAEKKAALKTSSPKRVRRKSVAKVIAESDPDARVPAILRRMPTAQATKSASTFRASYFRVTGKTQDNPDLTTLVGSKGKSEDWIMGTVPAKHKGKASNEALDDFIPDNQKDEHIMDRYKVSGFVSPSKSDTPLTPVNFRDVQDEVMDVSHLSQEEQVSVSTRANLEGTAPITLKNIEHRIRNAELTWPEGGDKGVQEHINHLTTLYKLRNKHHPGGIVHGEATRQQSFDQIKEVFKSEPSMVQAVLEVMHHLTRNTGDTAPSFATMRMPSTRMIQGTFEARDLKKAIGQPYNPVTGGDVNVNANVARQGPLSAVDTPFGITAHEIMHWAYHNVLNDNERLYFWENVVLPKGKDRMVREGGVSPEISNLSDSPNEYFANHAALYIEKNMPGALDQAWWRKVLAKTVGTVDEIAGLIGFKQRMDVDGHIVQILQRTLPDEFKTKLLETSRARVQKDVKSYKWVKIRPAHGERILYRANAFESVEHELQVALDSSDIDALPHAARNMAAHLLDSSHEKTLGGKLRKSMTALATAIFEATDSAYLTPETRSTWGSSGRKLSSDTEAGQRLFDDEQVDAWKEMEWADEGEIRFDDSSETGSADFATLFNDGIIDADGIVLDYESVSSVMRDRLGDRILPADEDGIVRNVSGEEVKMNPDDADVWLANQAAEDAAPVTNDQIAHIEGLFGLDGTKQVLREYEKIITQRYQSAAGVDTNLGWTEMLPPQMRQHYIKNDFGLPLERTDRSVNLQTARRKSAKISGQLNKRKKEIGLPGGVTTRGMDYDKLLDIALDPADPQKSKDAIKEIAAQVAEGRAPAKVTIDPAYVQMNRNELVTMLATIQKRKELIPAERVAVAQIKSEIRRRAEKKLQKAKNKKPTRLEENTVRGEVRDIGDRPVVDGIPHNTRSHLREILSRITERTPEKQVASRTVAYRIMNLTGLSDPRQPITNNHIATLAGRAVESTPDKPLTDFSDEGFKSFRSQVRNAVKNNDVVKMAQMAVRAGVLDAEELAAVKLSFKDEGQFLDRWVAHAKEGRAPLRGVRDEVLPDVESAMDNITSSVAYIMDGIDAFDNWYVTHPRLSEFADPLSIHRPKQSRDFARRLKGKKSVSQDMAGPYAKDVIDAMSVRTKRNLHAFIGTGMARTADGAIPYFVRSNGDTTAVLPVDGDFGPGVYASTRSKPYAKSLNEIVAEHLNEVEAPREKVATADSLATRLSDVRSDISDARATAEWHNLSDAGLDELLAVEARLASDLHKVTGRHYDQVAPVVCNCKRYADLSHTSDNKPQDWLVREFMDRVAEGGDAIAVGANITGAQNRPGGDRGRALYDAMWRSLASGSIADEVSAKARANEILKDMGYDGIKFTDSHRLSGGTKDQHVEYMIFNKDNVRRLDDPRFDEDDVLTFNTAPEDATIVTPIVRDIIEGGDGSNIGVAHTMERGGSEPTDLFVDNLRIPGRPKPESIVEAHRKGPTFYLRKGSNRLRLIGDRYMSNFFQKDKGTGIFERVDSEIGRKLMPIVRALNTLPGSTNAFQRWFRRSIDVRHRSRPSDAEYNVLWALRTGEETHLKTDGERLAYRRIRETFESEKEQLIHYGIMHSGIAKNYVPQVWSPTRISRNIVRAREKLADYFHQEALLRDEVMPREKAQDIAKKMISKILDDDGVHFPPQYASKNEPGLDNVDYQRMIMLQKPEFRGNLRELEEFLEGDLSSILSKYLDGSSRKIEFAKRFGQGNHGAMMYMRILRDGNEAAINALVRPREIRRTRRGMVDGSVETMQTKDEIPAPFGKNRFGAERLVADLIDVLKNPARGGVVEAERILKNPSLHKFPLSERKKFQWDRRAEAIVAGLEMNLRGELPPAETKLMENLLMASQRKQWGTDSYAYPAQRSISKYLRNFNALTMLSFTTVTSLTDPFIPLMRSGEMGSWLRGIRRYAADPDYRAMIKDTGLSIENYVHNRLVGMYGVDASKLTTAFFNATMLTPWTDSMRELAGIVGIEWFKTEQKRIARHGLNSRAGRRAKRVLESYGLDDYARPDSPSIEGLIQSRRHLGHQYDEAVDPKLVIESEKLRDALIKFANDTIFAPNTNDTPLWAQTPAGAMMWQLKSFPMMMARLGKDNIMEIWKDPKNWRSYKPMIMLAAMGPAGGAMALTAKDIIQMRGSEDEGIVRDRNVTSMREWLKAVGYDPEIHGTDPNDFVGWYFEGMLHVGGFGLYAELLHNAVEQADNGYYGYTRTMGNILGPSFGQTVGVWNAAQGLGNALFGEDDGPNGQARQAAREVIQRIPVVGGIKAVKESLTDLWAGEKNAGGGSSSRYGRNYSR